MLPVDTDLTLPAPPTLSAPRFLRPLPPEIHGLGDPPLAFHLLGEDVDVVDDARRLVATDIMLPCSASRPAHEDMGGAAAGVLLMPSEDLSNTSAPFHSVSDGSSFPG